MDINTFYVEAIYSMSWKILQRRIAATRRQSISKAELVQWQLQALEQAVDRAHLESLHIAQGRPHGE